MADKSVLSTEIETFNANKDRLLAESNGKFALVIGAEIVGTYVSERDALDEGYRRVGNSPFFVKKIVEFDNRWLYQSACRKNPMAGVSRFGITDLQQNGPLLQIAVHPTQAIRDIFAKEGKRYQPATVSALIDTGASNSMIDRAIPKDLGINTVGQTTLSSATHKDVPSELFDLTFVIMADFIKEVRCLEADFDGRPFRAIIGRDILANCLLVYTGWTNTFTLSQ